MNYFKNKQMKMGVSTELPTIGQAQGVAPTTASFTALDRCFLKITFL